LLAKGRDVDRTVASAVWEQWVACSNHVTPTNQNKGLAVTTARPF
jgi:hypothetical protein